MAEAALQQREGPPVTLSIICFGVEMGTPGDTQSHCFCFIWDIAASVSLFMGTNISDEQTAHF